ncbi:MAG: hypothetical protein M3Z10_13345 [Gemmatimonadota bacterium]|nr:hypothetical protein [Gemmatimonadota bacterium]
MRCSPVTDLPTHQLPTGGGRTRSLHSLELFLSSALLFVSPTNVVGQATAPRLAARSEPIYLIVRSDDGGMSHSVNMALERLITTGMPVSVSVMFAAPMYQETGDAELGALIDMNVDGGLPDMSRNRQGELDALTSGRFRDTVRARDVMLITYRQLIEMKGLKSMRRPGEG